MTSPQTSEASPSQVTPCKELGIGPTGTWPDGSPMYTLPAIHDPSTGTSIANSTAIARYLDATYPDTPRVIPEGTEAFHEAFAEALAPTLVPHLLYIHFPAVYGRLNEASKPYFKAARESVLGGKMEQWSPLGSETREQQWVKLEAGLGRIERWLTADGKERRFFMGDKPSFADFVLGARLLGLKRAIGEEQQGVEEDRTVARWPMGQIAAINGSLRDMTARGWRGQQLTKYLVLLLATCTVLCICVKWGYAIAIAVVLSGKPEVR